ncbi:hypothetical protein AK830_g7308 [Neonectria ditissima]|uniref:Uncharacterized protein n=1 Tax=Neonectria ditissima TaxID=78410 RepID=A0A0P7BGJ0_9HYPO|nr:hypothetical protein AK830_g7308 [Neonectria ditissima]
MAAEDPDKGPDPTFPQRAPALQSDNHVVFWGDNALVVMDTQDQGVTLDGTLRCTQKTLLVYAETVFLRDALISTPGLNLGIFCNQLLLLEETVCIDVSGNNGNPGGDTEPKGKNGGPGGSVWLYVEDPDPDLTARLTLKAHGGDGGHGFNRTVGVEPGGAGGDGGACGTLRCYVGNRGTQYGQYLLQTTTNSRWIEWVAELHNDIDASANRLVNYGVLKKTAASWKAAVTLGVDMASSLTKLQKALIGLTTPDPSDPDYVRPTAPTLEKAKDALAVVNNLLDSSLAPYAPEGFQAAPLNALAALCDEFSGGVERERELQGSLDAAMGVVGKMVHGESGQDDDPFGTKPARSLRAILRKMLIDLENEALQVEAALTHTVCQLGGGKGGPGGAGITPDVDRGKRGSDQPNKPPMALTLSLSLESQPGELTMEQAVAMPEQCQMLLDKADQLFVTTNPLNLPQARLYYERLARRLSFVDVIPLTRGKGADGTTPPPLSEAYQRLESSYGLTADAMTQLRRIHGTATSSLNKLMLGQDMFCTSPSWVPRLSFTFYKARVKTLLADFQEVEGAVTAFGQAQQKEQIIKAQVEQAQRHNSLTETAAREQMQLITRPGGDLETAGLTIARYTPQLAAARKTLAASLRDLQAFVENHFHVGVETITESLTMLAFAPHASMALIQGIGAGYRGWTKMENLEGVAVNKDYIVDQIDMCAGSISALTEAYKRGSRGELAVDDASHSKVLATAETMTQLLQDFKKAIPEARHEAVEASLRTYIGLVTKRNDAVIAYNAQVQFLLELQRIVAAAQDEARRLGDAALTLNPELPTIYFWLKRLRADAQRDILQRLNYEARAIAFWGPLAIADVVRFGPPAPVRGTMQLKQYQGELETRFESCYHALQGDAWAHWPGLRNFRKTGTVIDISKDVLAQLATPLGRDTDDSPDEDDVYEAGFTITPKSHSFFADAANVRLTQVRVWLLGAAVPPNPDEGDSHRLKVEITHLGGETVWNTAGDALAFSHEPTTLQFVYDAAIFNANKTPSGDPRLVYGLQGLEKDFADGVPKPNDRPPLGPFADWRIQVRRDTNPGLDMRGVTKVLLEFCGRNQKMEKKKKPEEGRHG